MAPGLLNGVVHRPVALAAIGAPDLFQLALGLVPPWMVADAEFDAEKKRLDIEDRFQTGGRNPRLTTTQQTYVLTRENLRTLRWLRFFEQNLCADKWNSCPGLGSAGQLAS